MNRKLRAIVEREEDGSYVALCPEVDIASQGSTVTEARNNLEEALILFFETASVKEIDRRLHAAKAQGEFREWANSDRRSWLPARLFNRFAKSSGSSSRAARGGPGDEVYMTHVEVPVG